MNNKVTDCANKVVDQKSMQTTMVGRSTWLLKQCESHTHDEFSRFSPRLYSLFCCYCKEITSLIPKFTSCPESSAFLNLASKDLPSRMQQHHLHPVPCRLPIQHIREHLSERLQRLLTHRPIRHI